MNRSIWMRTDIRDKKLICIAWLPLLLCTSLIFVLAACSNTDSTAAGQGTAVPTVSTPSSTSTPSKSETSSPVSSRPVVSSDNVRLNAIRMLDTKNGWGMTASTVLKTADGGSHWTDVTPANAGLNQFAKGDFISGQNAWIAVPPAQQQEGAGISILRTTDGGVSWRSSKINDPLVSIIDVPHFLNEQEGWFEASSTPGAGHAGSDIWHSTDGGQIWSKLSSNADNSGLTLGYVTGISMEDTQNGIAAGNMGAGGNNSVPSVSLTHNGGKTWQTQSLPHLLGGYEVMTNNSQPPVFFGNVVILPVNISTQSGELLVLYRSNDSGLHWVQTSVAHIHADNTYVLDTNHAWATDTQTGALYRTIDGGTNWSIISKISNNIRALSFVDANTGWGTTSKTFMHTTDGGRIWE